MIPVVLEPPEVLAVIVSNDGMNVVVQRIVVVMHDVHGPILDDVLVNDDGMWPESPVPLWRRVDDHRRRAHHHPPRYRARYAAAGEQAKHSSR